MSEIKAVIFDVGGVLTTSPVQSIRRFEVESGLESGALRQLFADPDGAWSRFEKSELSPASFVTAFEDEAEALGHRVSGQALLAAFFGGLTVREEMVAVVRALRGRYGLGCITNNVTREEDPGQRPLVLEDLFDVVVESSKVGMRKPDPRIYQLTCEQLGVEPREAVFLDDFGVNLKGARALGMTTIKVDESTAAIDELESALGISLPR